MASHKANKRSYKKRSMKKRPQKGGGVCDIICPQKKDEAETPEEMDKEGEVETPTTEEMDVEELEKEEEQEEPEEEEKEEEENIGGAKKSRKNKPKKGGKKNGKTAKKKKQSNWTKFVTELYKQNKLKNPNYMFKEALKEAAKLYKK